MRIGIIGAGAAAVGLLDALAVGAADPGEITVFEPSPHLWRGRPYGPDLASVLVNAPPAIMSIRHGDPGHYAAWLGADRAAEHLDGLLGQPVVPRALYGDYLAATAEAALIRLSGRGWRVRIVAARGVAAVRSGHHLVIRTDDGLDHPADQVAVCVGGGTPQDHYGLGAEDPYPLASTLARIPDEAAVVVIGSGLTAVDVVVSLAARGHAGRIALVSRTGMLPHVWQRPLPYRPVHVTEGRVAALDVTLDALAGLLREELAEAGEDFAEFAADVLAAETEDPVLRLRRQLDAVDDLRIGRRVLQETAHTLGPRVWRLLPESDRERLLRHHRLATSLASPMVPVNAAALMRLFESGQLSAVAGVVKIQAVRGGFRVRGDGGDLEAAAVVNAVNPPPQAVPRGAEPLVTSLVAAGLAAQHPRGGLVPADPRLHVVGDLAGGPFITSGIPGIAAAGTRTASALTSSPAGATATAAKSTELRR
ncbi:FAD/NAD(P)-binding protein [Nonomuraea guangzhouensis]|uniref:FAD/NAD(P)-binding protein n=1 Tax=Nonomuraea guangzhouensis TaxID=1291555 RepID=A0ABW4GV93_9ACTN|nr:FAD/NAD(P)-binding protein [Nonomuraea guangzhouensis]